MNRKMHTIVTGFTNNTFKTLHYTTLHYTTLLHASHFTDLSSRRILIVIVWNNYWKMFDKKCS